MLALLLFSFLHNSHQQQDDCEFTPRIINSTTIVELANRNCSTITGPIRLDETSDVTYEQLQETFHNIHLIQGPMEIVNTSFTNLSFMRTLFTLLSHSEEDKGCELDGPVTQALASTLDDNCIAIFGNFILPPLDAPSYDTLLRKFGTVTTINGEVAIVGTELVDLNFLGSLRKIFVEYDLKATEFVEKFLRIENNEKLKRLGWVLQSAGVITVQISGNPNLCYTSAEVSGLLTSDYINSIDGRICEDTGVIDGGEDAKLTCRIGGDSNLANIPANCGSLVGRLTIDNTTNSSELWKLFNVTAIYGQLHIKNASITGLAALWKVERVISFQENETAVVVESNQRLKSFFLERIKLIYSKQPVRIQNNPVMMLMDDDCNDLNKTAKVESAGNRRNCPGIGGYNI
ncbi:unnamed protein product [Haemonchus placei]|uniref:Recep_L_domain domain-containing protein n=1 Tax=Haemonchus placei TaxID=6290 RepID=A0A0N4X5M9_HAEPC|nr:unnamed protein product [Haemonchus placei]